VQTDKDGADVRRKDKRMPDDYYLTRAELARVFGIKSPTLGRWLREKRIPPPDKAVTQKTQQWRVSSLRAAGLSI